jgi:hypothetical protein
VKLIAHRGNTEGRNKSLENHPNYIRNTLKRGFDAEVDVWITDHIYLGHDEPQYKSSVNFLTKNSDKLWIHCKNLKALEVLNGIGNLNVFWHQEDDYTLTSKGFVWTFPGRDVCDRSVLVVKDATKYNGAKCFGLCSDTL